MMPIESGLNDSLNKLSELSSSSEVSKVNIKRPARGKPGSESARKLLGSILDDSAAAAEEERKAFEEKKRRAEEEERRRKEEEEERIRLEAERAIIAEKQAQEDLKLHQAEMQAKLQREKDIEAGIINLEEEARLAREAEERRLAEEEAKRRKAQAKKEAIELKKSQESELSVLKQDELARRSVPQKSKAPLIAAVAALIIVIGGVAAFFAPSSNVADPYALQGADQYDTRKVVFAKEKPEYSTMETSVVAQEAPKVVKKQSSSSGPKKPKAPAAQQPAQQNKPGLKTGGGLLGGGRRL